MYKSMTHNFISRKITNIQIHDSQPPNKILVIYNHYFDKPATNDSRMSLFYRKPPLNLLWGLTINYIKIYFFVNYVAKNNAAISQIAAVIWKRKALTNHVNVVKSSLTAAFTTTKLLESHRVIKFKSENLNEKLCPGRHPLALSFNMSFNGSWR